MDLDDPMFRPRYYGRLGEPLALEEFARRFEDLDYRRVAWDAIPATRRSPPSFLSTVWLGIDHSWFPHLGGPPVIFETMRFAEGTERNTIDFWPPDGDEEPTEQVRYRTEEEAHLGHQAILRLIQERELQ